MYICGNPVPMWDGAYPGPVEPLVGRSDRVRHEVVRDLCDKYGRDDQTGQRPSDCKKPPQERPRSFVPVA